MTYKIKGYACFYNYIDDGGDLIEPHALEKSTIFKNPDHVKMLYQHDVTRPIGRWTSFKQDTYGLYAEGDIYTSLDDGEMSAELLDKQIIDGLSIGFITHHSTLRSDNVRVLEEIEIREISLVTFPMQNIARTFKPQEEDNVFEHFLSSFGMTLNKETEH